MSFEKCIHMWIYHCNQDIEHFIAVKGNFVPLPSQSSPSNLRIDLLFITIDWIGLF